MIDFNLWLEAKRKKRFKKLKQAPKISQDIDVWLRELELLSKDLQDLQKAKRKFDSNKAKKKTESLSAKKKSDNRK